MLLLPPPVCGVMMASRYLYPLLPHARMYQSTLLEFILTRLAVSGNHTTSRRQWFVRWLWTTAVGSVVYALSAGFLAVATCLWCRGPRAETTRDAKTGEQRAGDIETGREQRTKPDDVTCVVATFNAWLFADSDALWAVLISEIFNQVGCCAASNCYSRRNGHIFLRHTAIALVFVFGGGKPVLGCMAVKPRPTIYRSHLCSVNLTEFLLPHLTSRKSKIFPMIA